MADNVIHRLSLVGYWSDPAVPPERSRGWPDPRDLTGAWEGADRLATLAHLRRGKVFRVFAGASECRICATALGSHERSDGVWAWPDGLEHYVDAHDIRLPEAFVTACRHPEWSVPAWLDSVDAQLWVQCGESAAPVSAADAPTWTVDDSAWLDWAAENTPARPAEDASSLADAREVCRRLSHPGWSCDAGDVSGRWRVSIRVGRETVRIYVHRCSAPVLERRLLSLRIPDPSRILDLEQARSIAREYDGPWGAARVAAAHPGAWLIWVREPEGDWPADDQIHEILGTELRLGWTTYHLRLHGRSYLTLPCDEPAWRWILIREREQGEHTLGQQPATAPEASCRDDVNERGAAIGGWWSRILRSFRAR